MSHCLSTKLVSCVVVLSLVIPVSVSSVQAQTTHKTIWETRVFVEPRCPTEPPQQNQLVFAPLLIAVLGFLIPKVIDFGVSFAQKALQAKAQEEQDKNKPIVTGAVGAADNFYKFYQKAASAGVDAQPVVELALNESCVVVMRANFGQPSQVPANDCQKFKSPALKKEDTCEWLHRHGVYGSSNGENAVGIYLEAKLKFSEERSSFRLQPNYFAYFVPIRPQGTAEAQPDESDTKGFYDMVFNFSFESGTAGQTATPFGLAILPFLTLSNPAFNANTPNPTVLTSDVLLGKSSSWTPILPLSDQQTAELKRVKDLYDTRKALADQKDQLDSGLPAIQAKTSALLTEVSAVAIPAPAVPVTGQVFNDAQAEAIRRINDELFDDVLVAARLDGDLTATPVPGDTPAQLTQKKIVRQQKMRNNAAYRAKVSDLKLTAELGLKNRADKKQAEIDLASKEKAIKAWARDPLDIDNVEHLLAPVSVRVTITEQPYLPTNYFLLTAADSLASSKSDITTFISQNAIQALGLEGRDAQVNKVSDQAQLLVAAMGALNTAQDAQAAFDKLLPTATDQEKRQVKLALDTAKINANVAYLKAGLDPPFKDAFGG
jgi:hypothetical protein